MNGDYDVKIKNHALNNLFSFNVEKLSDYMNNPDINRFRFHRSETYMIIYLENGSAEHRIDDKKIKISDNQLLFLDPYCIHHFDRNGNYEKGIIINFSETFWSQSEWENKFLYSSPLFWDEKTTITAKGNTPDEKNIRFCANYLLNKFQDCKNSIFILPILGSSLHSLVYSADELFYNSLPPTGQNQRLQSLKKNGGIWKFLRALRENIPEMNTLDFYANEFNMTPQQLSKMCKSITGETPKGIMQKLLLEEAKRLLIYSDLSVKEIGNKLGFSETTNFIKFFRKNTQITPTTFKNSIIDITC